MDSGKFATVSPDIASFVIKSCLELRNEKKFHETYGKTTEDPYFAMAICNDGALRSFVTLPWYIIKLHKPYAYVYLSELGKFIKNLSNENHHHPHGLVA